MLKFLPKLLAAALALNLSACAALGVYRIDLPQGTPLTQTQIQQVKVGMSKDQVRELIGTPSLSDPAQPNRWDYLYHYKPGTYARQAGLKPVNGQHLILYFDAQDTLQRMEGQSSIPAEQPGLPASRDRFLNAEPL